MNTINTLLNAAKSPLSATSLQLLSSITVQNVIDVLQHTVRNIDSVDTIASLSYSHDLGFDKIILAEGEHGERVRLHIWDNNQCQYNLDSVDIHDHYWDFSSLVLKGVLHSRIYKISATGGESRSHLIHNIKPLGNYELIYVGNQNLELIDSYTITKGNVHCLGSNDLHSIINDNATISLVLQGPRIIKKNCIFRNKAILESTERSSIRKMTSNKLTRIISRVVAVLEANV